MYEICMSGSMSEVWKRSHGPDSKAPPIERGVSSYAEPTATSPHPDSTESGRDQHQRTGQLHQDTQSALAGARHSGRLCLRDLFGCRQKRLLGRAVEIVSHQEQLRRGVVVAKEVCERHLE